MSILLTGASGGIGQAIFPELHKIDIPIGIYNNTTPLALGEYAKVDITNSEAIKLFIAGYKPNKITLIHLAAVKIDELAVFVNESNWDKVFNVNVKGAFFLTKELLPIMMREKWGRILFVISSGLLDLGTVTYSASKYGIIGLSGVLSREYARYGITSNILQLGYFPTGLWNSLPQAKKDELQNEIPSKQLGNPKDIVNAIKMIIDSPFVNGAVINVDGGV